MDLRPATQLDSGRWVPAQPHPFYDWRHWLRSWKCWLGKHSPGAESDGWFCEVCLKQVRGDHEN